MNKQKIKIAIDGNEANKIDRVGSNVYAFEIIKALEKIIQKEPVEVIIYLSSKPVNDLPQERRGWKYQVIKPAKFWTQWRLPIELFLKRHEIDVFFTPGHYAPRISSVPYISSVMDLAFLKFPKQFKRRDQQQLKNWTYYSVKNASHVITISKSTQKDIQQFYHISSDKISIAYPALNKSRRRRRRNMTQDAKVMKKFGIDSPYILYVGTIQPRKNLIRLVEAYEKLVRKLQGDKLKKKQKRLKKRSKKPNLDNLKLVIAGKVGWLADETLAAINQSKLKNRIILTGFVNEVKKDALFAHAKCLALVGLYEGFGMPALESLWHRCVPVVSKTSSLPEVVGKAGIKVNPESVISIMRGLDAALHMTTAQQKEFERAAAKQLKKFSWERSAQHILRQLIKLC